MVKDEGQRTRSGRLVPPTNELHPEDVVTIEYEEQEWGALERRGWGRSQWNQCDDEVQKRTKRSIEGLKREQKKGEKMSKRTYRRSGKTKQRTSKVAGS